ncbi:MAG: hypothetical protein N2Z22_04905, partial [Turneriella sp.]|nr:hypothetical protein [Turneriella sp.]
PYPVGGRADFIRTRFERGILEIRFDYDPLAACKALRGKDCKPGTIRLAGFVWELATIERIPQGEINFSPPVEYLYLGKSGNYFINARGIFRGPERNQFIYDSRSVEIPDLRAEFRRQVFAGLAIVLAALLLLAFLFRRRLAFYAGALSA